MIASTAVPDQPRGGRGSRAEAAARRRRAVRRQRLLALVAVALIVAAALFLALKPGGGPARPARVAKPPQTTPRTPTRPLTPAPAPPRAPAAPAPAVGLRVVALVDHARHLRGGGGPRRLTTVVRYPATAAHPATDLRGAAPALSGGPYPLIVFGHGFSVTPGLYARLLQSWTRAGYVVAAPVFPLENQHAPGGPDESDLPNQPGDMRFVISSLLARSANAADPLHGLIDPRQIAVAGQSDGGDSALALAYNRRYRDFRVRAAAILSGAEIPGQPGFSFPVGGPPLLATQGTADSVNPPQSTQRYFAAAHRPKYLLELLGASHLAPYQDQQPQLGIVEHVSIAFFDLYLKRKAGAQQRLASQGTLRGVASLRARP